MSLGIEPAFPVPNQFRPDGEWIGGGYTGITLHQWFVGMALQGLLAGYSHRADPDLAGTALRYADEIVAALDKRRA